MAHVDAGVGDVKGELANGVGSQYSFALPWNMAESSSNAGNIVNRETKIVVK